MLKRIKVFAVVASTLGLLLMPVAASAATNNVILNNACQGANLNVTTDDANCSDTAAAESTVNGIITTVIDIFSILVGIIAVVMIIIGGIKYITSGGDPANVTGAKNTILYAIIGLVVVALAQILVKFVLAKVSSS